MRLTFLGDIMCTKMQLDNYKTQDDFNKSLACIKAQFSNSHYVIANLETPIAGEKYGLTKEQYQFNSPIELAKALKTNGIAMVTTANNHCLDSGINGMFETIDNLDKNNLEHIGTYKTRDKSYLIKNFNGVKVGFLAFTYGTNAFSNNNYLKKKERYLVDLLQQQELYNPVIRKIWLNNSLPFKIIKKIARILNIGQFRTPIYERKEKSKNELKNFLNTIRECKNEGVDYLVACLHIGGQYNERPTKYTKKICQIALDLGVNAIIANHEHVIHPIHTKCISNEKFCIYSLGNFLSSSGVLEGPFDKKANYSIAINIDLNQNNANLNVAYTFEIFCSIANSTGLVESISLYEYILNCKNQKEKDALLNDNNYIVNRVFDTRGIKYPFTKEYNIPYKEEQ